MTESPSMSLNDWNVNVVETEMGEPRGGVRSESFGMESERLNPSKSPVSKMVNAMVGVESSKLSMLLSSIASFHVDSAKSLNNRIWRLGISLSRTRRAAASSREAIDWVVSTGCNCSILEIALAVSEKDATCEERSRMAIRLVRGNRVTIQVAISLILVMRLSSGVFHDEEGELSRMIAMATGSIESIAGAGPEAKVYPPQINAMHNSNAPATPSPYVVVLACPRERAIVANNNKTRLTNEQIPIVSHVIDRDW